jgi:hypothetical protein
VEERRLKCECGGIYWVLLDDYTDWIQGKLVTKKNVPSVYPCPAYRDYFKGLVDLESAVVLAPGEGVCPAAIARHREMKERARRDAGDGRKGRGRF